MDVYTVGHSRGFLVWSLYVSLHLFVSEQNDADFANIIGMLTTTTTVLWPFVLNSPDEPVPEETLTHPPS